MQVGRVGAPYGVGGALRVWPDTDFPERLARRERVWLWPAAEPARPGRQAGPVEHRVEWARPHGRQWLVKLAAVTDRTAAAALTGCLLGVPVEELEPLPEGQYYHHEVVGLRVRDAAGCELGTVCGILREPAHDVYLVRTPGGREWLLPAVRAVIREIDLAAGVMRVEPPAGLVEQDRE